MKTKCDPPHFCFTRVNTDIRLFGDNAMDSKYYFDATKKCMKIVSHLTKHRQLVSGPLNDRPAPSTHQEVWCKAYQYRSRLIHPSIDTVYTIIYTILNRVSLHQDIHDREAVRSNERVTEITPLPNIQVLHTSETRRTVLQTSNSATIIALAPSCATGSKRVHEYLISHGIPEMVKVRLWYRGGVRRMYDDGVRLTHCKAFLGGVIYNDLTRLSFVQMFQEAAE